MHIHIVGVAGTGMAALAGLLVELGHRVTGSDVGFHPPMGPRLAGWGVQCLQGFRAEHLEPKPDLVVVGNVCRRDNAEARAALDHGLAVTHVAGALARFALPGAVPLVVAGTHGKTTTASLAAWLAESVGLKPGFFIGGVAENFGRGFRLAEPGSPMVLEGDEYDTAFFEKSAKFLHYQARHAILTSVEYDHIDIYPTQQSYEHAFERFITGLPADGVLIANAADPRVCDLVQRHAHCQVHWYGARVAEHTSVPGSAPASDGTWTVEAVDASAHPQRFEIHEAGYRRASVALPLLGRHNAHNALAACLALHFAFDVPLERLTHALSTFRGSKRRQELLGTPGGVHVYDDFAHHPTAVRETLAALRARHPQHKLVAAFEPRSATACRTLHQEDYAHAFRDADLVLLAPVARAELPPEEKLDIVRLARALSAQGIASHACESVADVQGRILDAVGPSDAVALLSNGTFGGIHAALQGALSARSS